MWYTISISIAIDKVVYGLLIIDNQGSGLYALTNMYRMWFLMSVSQTNMQMN